MLSKCVLSTVYAFKSDDLNAIPRTQPHIYQAENCN